MATYMAGELKVSNMICVIFSVGVERGLGQEDGVLLWGYTEFIVESAMPDFLHIIPVSDDAVFNGVFEGEDTSLALGLVPYIAVLLAHTNHNVNALK